MPHQCIRCGTVYEDISVVLKGCSKCGSKFFYFFKEVPKKEEVKLSEKEAKELEKEIRQIVEMPEDKPVILDMETVKAIKPGKFEIDLINLFKGNPIVFKIEEGKYIIDIASTFQLIKKKENGGRD